MGFLSQSVRALLPETKAAAIASTVATWDAGVPQYQQHTPQSYTQLAHGGYLLDEIVFATVEARATSASEPRMAVYRDDESDGEKIDNHPSLKLLHHPNPFMDAATFWAAIVMSMDIGGNAYVEKVRSGSGKLVELWLLRPDRTWVIPDAKKYIRGYRYVIGDKTFELPAEDVIHFKTRHPLDDYYGLPPLSVLAGRIDLDIWCRQFAEAFFRNAGVPAGLLNIERAVTQQERELIKSQFRNDYGGPQGWHNTMVISGGKVTYEPMGLPLGPRGTAVGELDEINEARICSVMGVPPSVIGARLAMKVGSLGQAGRDSDRKLFWDSTLAPIYHYLGATLTTGLKDEYPGQDIRWAHDLSTVQALREDEDLKHARAREDFLAGVITRKEARVHAGYPADPDDKDLYYISTRMVPTPSDWDPADEPAQAPRLPTAPTTIEQFALGSGQAPAGAQALTEAQRAELLPGEGRTNGTGGKALGNGITGTVRPRGKRLSRVPTSVRYTASDLRALSAAWDSANPGYAGLLEAVVDGDGR